ncbi:MAG: TonB-dependent receptor plug domain-containing protein, partial [Gemmatimonadota bacterium]
MSSKPRTRLSISRPLATSARVALLVFASAGTGAVSAEASSVPRQEPALADTLTKRAFDIPRQSLASALAEFRRQSGLRVTSNVSIRPGALSPGVSGTLTPSAGLRALLAGTGLSPVFSDGSTVALKRDRAPVQTIAPVEVVAKRGRKGGYAVGGLTSATKTATLLRDVPQSITVVTKDQIADQSMQNMADVVRYVPGITMGQGEGNRDQPTIRGNSTSAGFFVDGVRDDVQYFRDLYNVERVEALKGANALIFGRGVGGGVINRVSKEADWSPVRELGLQGGSYDNKRVTTDLGQGLSDRLAVRLNGMYESSDQFRHGVSLERWGINPTLTIAPTSRTKVTVGFEHFNDHRTADRGLPSFAGGPAGGDIKTFFGDPDVSYARARVDAGAAAV